MKTTSDKMIGEPSPIAWPILTSAEQEDRVCGDDFSLFRNRSAYSSIANAPGIVKKGIGKMDTGIHTTKKTATCRTAVFFLIFLIVVQSASVTAGNVLKIGDFSRIPSGKTIPDKWEPLEFKDIENQTRYEIVQSNGQTVVKASSENSASGLVRKIKIDPVEYPWIEWRWKIENVYEKGDATKKEGDDYPARIYITFEYDPEKLGFFQKAKYEAVKLFYGDYPPHAAINYIWANKTPKGAFVPNPYTDRVMMIAVESGAEHANTWKTEKRNILEDYRKAFGENPPPLSGVAIMTDSDNTGESAVAYYGDIVVRDTSLLGRGKK